MLQALQAKVRELPAEVSGRVTVVPGDMRMFDLDQRFALIICPFRAFLHNVTESDQLACLRRVSGSTCNRPDGFAFNVFHPSLTYMAENAGPLAGVWRWEDTHVRHPAAGW